MQIETVNNYLTLSSPSPLALPNLRRITKFMVENTFISPQKVAPVTRIAEGAGVSYTQTRNLMNRPGFVKLADHNGRVIGYYYESALGLEYPDILPPRDYPREVRPVMTGQTGGVSTGVISTGNARADAAINSQLKAEAFLKPGQFIVDPTITKRTGEFTKAAIASTLSSMGTAMLTGERSPQQLAQAIAEIAYSIQNGIMTVKD